MMSSKILTCLAVVSVCLLVLAAGFAPAGKTAVEPEKPIPTPPPVVEVPETPAVIEQPPAQPTVKEVQEPPTAEAVTLALKFTEHDSVTYKVIMEEQQSLDYEGFSPTNAKLQNKRDQERVELTFTQQTQSVNDKGYAIQKITIKAYKVLKAVARAESNPVLDFDSAREEDQKHPLIRLIGQSYTIEVAPDGSVSGVIEANKALAAVKGPSSIKGAAVKLLQADTIKKRHGTLTLPNADEKQLRPGGKWTTVTTFPFRLLGSKSYEKIYTLKEVKSCNNKKIAVVEMDTIPTTKTSDKSLEQQLPQNFMDMLDNTIAYTGRLKLNLTDGKIEEYFEKLESEWVIVDPEPTTKEPSAIKMGAIRLYSIERID